MPTPAGEAKKRILVVDDDGLSRALLRSILERAGYEVDDAPDGIQGVEMFRQTRYDLAIVDLYMPHQDGFDTIDQMDPQGSGVPVIAMSATPEHTGTDPLGLARTLGASATFHKDFQDEEFLKSVWRLTHGGEQGPVGPWQSSRPGKVRGM